MIKRYEEINQLMKDRGIQTDPKTGKEYFTGYAYRHLYDWDQYFEGIVQLYLGWGTKYLKNAITIFLDYQNDEGFSPRGVGVSNGCEEQTHEMVKPFLSQIALLVYNRDGNIDFLDDEYYGKLKKYLMYWCRRAEECGYLAYWNSAVHTGMDNQHERAGYWQENYCLGVDLNCYLIRECKAFSILAEIKGEMEDCAYFNNFSNEIRKAVQQKMWDEEEGIYYDINRFTGEKIKVKYIGAFLPMWLNLATEKQADDLINKHLKNKNEFNRGFLYPAMAANEPGYSETLLETDISYLCNWRANTWIPSNYFVFHGLKNYGYFEEATILSEQTFETVENVGIYEYYTSESKQGCGLHPFWGWTLLAYFMPIEDKLNFDPTVIEKRENHITLL